MIEFRFSLPAPCARSVQRQKGGANVSRNVQSFLKKPLKNDPLRLTTPENSTALLRRSSAALDPTKSSVQRRQSGKHISDSNKCCLFLCAHNDSGIGHISYIE
jgi:hypothetical protein